MKDPLLDPQPAIESSFRDLLAVFGMIDVGLQGGDELIYPLIHMVLRL
jgi:hypothetical protein